MTTAPAPNRNITLAGPQRHNPPAGRTMPGTVEGFVYWETHAVTHNPAGACNGFSVSVIQGGHVLAAASGQFGAKPIAQVKSFLANGTTEVYDVCTYAYDNLPENTPLRVELNITQSAAFSTAVAPATPISEPLTIINARCNMLPDIATATLADLRAHWGSCQNMAFDVNFQLVPASAAARAAMLSPATRTLVPAAPGAANVPSSGGTLLNAGSNTTLLDRSQQPAGGGSNSTLQPLVPRGSSNTGSGGGTGGTTLRPLIPRGSSTGGSNTASSSAGSEKPLTNPDVLKLLRAGISEQNILTTIRTHRAAFDISNQARANFDKECAAIEPAGVSAGAWGAEVANIWNTMTDVVICQETNGRGGEGSCVLKGNENKKNKYDAVTLERGVTQDNGFAKWASGGTGGTTAGNNGNKNADDLNPQPYPPKSTAAAASPQFSETQLRAGLAKGLVPGKRVPITVKRRVPPANAAILAALRKQRQAADAEEAQMMKLGIRPATLTSAPGVSQPMSATVGGSGTQLNNRSSVSSAPSATATTASSYSQRMSTNSAAHLGVSESIALMCAQDPSMRIVTVSGSSSPATFTPTDQYNLYTIRGCSFGNQSPTNDPGPTDWVHIYGGTGSFHGKFTINFWSDNEIDVALDETLTGFPDLNNITLVVKRGDGQEAQKGGFSFYAARQWVALTTIPQSWVTLASVSGVVCGDSSLSNCWRTSYSTPPATPALWPTIPGPATQPAGPSAASAYVSRMSNGLKAEGLSGVSDYYDFSHLAPGWTTDPSDTQHQPQFTTYDEYCPAGGGWTLTYKQSFGTWSGQWDGNNLEIGLSETSCSGFIAPGFINYQNISGSFYELRVWVIGPRGTDPLTDQPVQ